MLEKKKPSKDKFVYKIYFKKNGNSMLLFNHLLCSQALRRRSALKKMYNDWKGQFIVTK